MPSRADTAPSCIAPSRESSGSSSCSAITPPHSRWYCSALRSVPADTTGLPSSVKPSAPASRSSAISVSSLPLRSRVIAARKPTGTLACRCAVSVSERRIDASSTTGSVLGMAITAQKPPAAAAAVPDSRFSLYSWPGVRRCTCGSTKPGNRCLPAASMISVSAAGRDGSRARRARRSARGGSARRVGSSSSARGSSTWAPRIRSSAGRPGRWNRRSVAHHATAARVGAPTSSS